MSCLFNALIFLGHVVFLLALIGAQQYTFAVAFVCLYLLGAMYGAAYMRVRS